MTITIGNTIPDFDLPSSFGRNITRNDLKGAVTVVYFYPKDDTPGCTAQACDFRDNFNAAKKQGVAVLGVSKDSLKAHAKFVEKYDLNFPLLSDEDGKMIEDFGVWVEKSMYGKKYMGIERATFLLDTDARVVQIWRNVKVPGHVAEVLAAAANLVKQNAA